MLCSLTNDYVKSMLLSKIEDVLDVQIQRCF